MNIIVNGGTHGIGKEVVNNLAQNSDNRILVTGRDEDSLLSISRASENVKTFRLDLSLFESQQEKFIEKVIEYIGEIDILINVAGYLVAKDFMEMTDEDARKIMDTNFFGQAFIIRALKPYLKAGSHIVNISSMGGFQGSTKFRGLSYYSASKAALACLTECLAVEFAKDEIAVNCLALGAVQTEMFEKAFPGHKAPVEAKEMAEFISGFALTGQKLFNGKILPVAAGNPE
jgi:NAD(P)-dependent dehydrogenase (short-subunit alcohol dehydrogenase family)